MASRFSESDQSKSKIPRQGGGARGGRVKGRRYETLPEEQVDFFLVLDFEGVNNKFHGGPDIMELIEFPVLKVNARTFEIESEFHSYIQPTIHTKINPVCTEITGITQEMVDGQPTLPEVLRRLDEWMKGEGLLVGGVKSCFVTCGDWDLMTGLPTQCRYQNLKYPDYLRKWINIKDVFQALTGRKGHSMKKMLADLSLRLEGRHHSGIDDSRNIAKILRTLAQKDPHRLSQGLVTPKLLKNPDSHTQ